MDRIIVEDFQITHKIEEFKVGEVIYSKFDTNSALTVLNINVQTGVVVCKYKNSPLTVFLKCETLIKNNYKALVKIKDFCICYN